uniref:Trithorax group protein osa n=1 Tax=Panagrellus redivivus TaxID=6233 RepID=A0A7E4W2E0_PANRE
MSNPGKQQPPNMPTRMQVQYVPPNQSGMPPRMMNPVRMPGRPGNLPDSVTPSNVFQWSAQIPALHDKVRNLSPTSAAVHVNRILENNKKRAMGNPQMRPMGQQGMMQRAQYGAGGPGGPGNFHPMMNPNQNQPQFPAGQPPPQPLGNQQQPPISQAGGIAFPGPGPTAQNPSTINPRTPQQPGSNQPVTSVQSNQQQLRNPGSIQPPGSQQTQNHPNGPSPMVQPIPSVGNPGTPSQQSIPVQPLIDTNSPEYKAAYAELQRCRAPMLLLLDKMKVDNHPGYFQMVKMLDVMENSKSLSIDLINRLITNVQGMLTRYDMTRYAQQVGMEIRRGRTRFPKGIDPYAKYANERIGAPKHFYEQALKAEKRRSEQLYVKRKAKWFSESNFTPGDPEYPYPSIVYNDVNMESHLERLNAIYNNGQEAFFVEEHTAKKVKINLETEYIVRLDRLVNLRDGKEVEPEVKDYQEFEILPDQQTLHYDEDGVLIQSMPSTSKETSSSDEGPPKKRKCMLDMRTGSSSILKPRKPENSKRIFDENFYCQPIFDVVTGHKEVNRDCRFNCCVPYFIESIQGKQILIPQAAATELRRYRHRADKEFQPLSEYAGAWSVVINPTKVNSKYPCPELRIILTKYYPARPAAYEILRPNPLQEPIVDKFYDTIEEKMQERRQCDVSLHSITDIVSAFRYCVEYTYSQKDVFDFRNVVVKTSD